MANLPETPQWEDGIYQIEVSDPVLGGPDGISNRQAKQLAKRTSYLKQQVEKGGTDLAAHIAAADPHTQYAPKASPVFTGMPTAPTPAANDNSKKLVTTEFVARAISALAGTAPETLDTLKELADALGNDPNFATTVLNKLAEKLAKDQNGADIPDPSLFVKNLNLQFLKSAPSSNPASFTSVLSPDEKLRIVIANNGEWGVQDSQGNTVALPLTRGGTGANNAKQAVINLGLGAGAPAIGMPFFWPSSAMPNTVMPEWSDMVFLKYNGSNFSASAYPKLALVNPSLTLPDVRGEFIRVWDDGRGVDSGRALLSAQSDAQQAVTGSVVDVTMGVNASASGAFQMTQLTPTGLTAGTASDFNQKNVYLDTSRVNRTAAENRPRNVAFNFLVRAK
ncbi:TPA: phage tail protein [Enterobacter chengduensis]